MSNTDLLPSTYAVPREVVELIAEIGVEDQHDDNGPGSIVCRACGESSRMRWSIGRRFDQPSDIAHNSICPAQWARTALAQPIQAESVVCANASSEIILDLVEWLESVHGGLGDAASKSLMRAKHWIALHRTT